MAQESSTVMSKSAKQAVSDIRSHIVTRVVNNVQACIDFARVHVKGDAQLTAKLTTLKTAADDVVSYIDSRIKNG